MHKILENENIRISYREGNITGEHIFENHCHARYEIIAVIEGEIRIVIENRRYDLKAGEIALIPPLKYHSIFTVGELLYKRITVLFNKNFIPEQISNDFSEKINTHPVAANGALPLVFTGMKDIFFESDAGKFMPLAESLLTQALYIHTYCDITPPSEKTNPLVKSITEYIDAHISEKIFLDDVAAHVFVSKSTVCHLFSDEMKISLKQYVLQKKLSYAAKLIEEGFTASEAARMIGYDNYANFYKMYVKVFGLSPKRANVK